MGKKTFIGEDGKEYVAKVKKPFYKKWWFIALAIIVVIGIIGSLGGGTEDSGNTQAPNSSSNSDSKPAEKEYTVVDAGQMLADLDTNALKAEKTYKGTNVEVTGKILTIDSSGKYISIDGVNDEYTITGIMCNLTSDEQRDLVAEMEKGQTITVKGEVTDVGEVIGFTLKTDSLAAQ